MKLYETLVTNRGVLLMTIQYQYIFWFVDDACTIGLELCSMSSELSVKLLYSGVHGSNDVLWVNLPLKSHPFFFVLVISQCFVFCVCPLFLSVGECSGWCVCVCVCNSCGVTWTVKLFRVAVHIYNVQMQRSDSAVDYTCKKPSTAGMLTLHSQ